MPSFAEFRAKASQADEIVTVWDLKDRETPYSPAFVATVRTVRQSLIGQRLHAEANHDQVCRDSLITKIERFRHQGVSKTMT